MKLKCIVISDKLETWPAKGNSPAGQSRRLTCMDIDDTPLTALVAVSIPENDKLGGDIHQGASLANQAITLSIVDWRQSEKTKAISGRGTVASVDGMFSVQPHKKAA